MSAHHDGFTVRLRPQCSQSHEEQHRVQRDEERGEPVHGKGDSKGGAPAPESVNQNGAARGGVHEPKSEEQDPSANEQRRATRGLRGGLGDPEHERSQPGDREEDHQTHESDPRPSSSARMSSAVRSPSPSGGGASSGAPPLCVCAAIPASR